jgi:hypothetical protein
MAGMMVILGSITESFAGRWTPVKVNIYGGYWA